MKYIFRIIALPFWAALALISALRGWGIFCKNFLLYGGEAVSFTELHRQTTLADILNYLQDKRINNE